MFTKGGCSGKAHLPRLLLKIGLNHISAPSSLWRTLLIVTKNKGVREPAPSCPRCEKVHPSCRMLSFNPQMSFRSWLCSPMPQQSPLVFVTENSGRNFNFKRTAQQLFKWHLAPGEGLEQPLGDGTRPEELSG